MPVIERPDDGGGAGGCEEQAKREQAIDGKQVRALRGAVAVWLLTHT